MRLASAIIFFAATACAGAPSGANRGSQPSPAREPLHITVVYPDTADPIQAQDSSFLFGSVGRGRGDVALSINGFPVRVTSTGSWLAWIPLPPDSLARFQIIARAGAGSEQQETTFVARIAQPYRPPTGGGAGVWIDTTSFTPSDTLVFPAGEGVRLAVRATPGARVRLRIEGRRDEIWFVPDTLPEEPAWGIRAFGTDTATYRLAAAPDRYVAWVPAMPLCDAIVEAILGTDTARAVWPLVLDTMDRSRPRVVVLNDDTAHTGKSDSLTVGKAVPYGTYNWFFPLGTTAVATARWGSQTRLQLSRGAVAWVNSADVVPLDAGTPPPGGIVGSVRLSGGGAPQSLLLRVPLPARVPFQVEESDRSLTLRLYGVASDVNWMQHGGTDPYVTRMSYAQPVADEVTITLTLAGPVWGYRTRWSGRDLLLEIRRPPAIDPRRPLRGRTIVLDPGHPPIGAHGPSGLWEPVATLAVAQRAKALLEQAGATVLMTRTDSSPVDLFPRTRFAEQHDADVLVSIHANALPDGVNPFVNNGTSVYYFHPRSAALARALDRALVGELGVRDLGMGRGDYALVRNPWMPAALTEGLFMMIPEQEAMLASPEGQLRYARGVVRGIEDFLREMAN